MKYRVARQSLGLHWVALAYQATAEPSRTSRGITVLVNLGVTRPKPTQNRGSEQVEPGKFTCRFKLRGVTHEKTTHP